MGLTLFEQNKHKPTTKTGKVLKHLQEQGSITSWDAIQLYRVTRLAAVILNLKQEGYQIQSVNESKDGTHWTRYVYQGQEGKPNNKRNYAVE